MLGVLLTISSYFQPAPLAPLSPPAVSVKVDGWQATSAPSFSPTFGGGTGNSLFGAEASLSVLADRSAGFEPPAPPTVESDHGHRPEHDNDGTNNSANNNNHHSGSSSKMGGHREGRGGDRSTGGGGGSSNGGLGEGRPDVGAGRGEGVRNDSRGDLGERGHFQIDEAAISRAGDNHPGDYHRSTPDHHAVASVAAGGASHDVDNNAAPKAPGNGYSDRRATGVLRGVSAAMASGALPVAERPNPNVISAADREANTPIGGRREAFPDDEESSGRLPRVVGDDTSRAGGRRLNSAGFRQMTSTGGGEGGGGGAGGGDGGTFVPESSGAGIDACAGSTDQAITGNWRPDERGEQARRHIDQALRQRALRRRNRCATL